MTSLRFVGRAVALSFVSVGVLALFGCSDPSPPDVQGAFTVTFGNAVGTGVTCPATSPSAELRVGSVTDSQKATVKDGENGAIVKCRVVPRGKGYLTEGSIQKGTTTLVMSGVLVGSDQSNTGIVSISGSNTGGAYRPVSGTTCTWELLQGAEGRIWMKFECPHVSRPSAPNSDCSLSNGIVVFENCDTE